VLLLAGTLAGAAQAADKVESKETLHLSAGQKEFLWLEPVLVTVRIEGLRGAALPAVPGAGKSAKSGKAGTLRFEVDPVVKPRPGARPLPLEAQADDVQTRHYDLSEWFTFPDKGGPWTVRAVFEHQGTRLVSTPVSVSLRRPTKGDAEHDPVARIHHTPWSNYDTNAFCGDTFDLVKQWPQSRLARYCHYWNGRYSQNKKEYDKAIASYRTVVEKYPDFALADAAAFGIVECLCAQKKMPEARQSNAALAQKLRRTTSPGAGTGVSAVRRLVDGMSQRLDREVGRK
jgi:hypothetical protein